MLTAALAVAAFVAGMGGTWSPCGLSMIETIGGPGRRVGTSCVTFTLGALAGGAATFVVLGLAGSALPLPARLVPAIGIAAALVEACGLRIVPQIRRQVPERWRRVLPLPLAAALYGVLLGLGFTTFVYTFALWAVAAVTLVLGSPGRGLGVGLAFGLGRALPVVLVAPIVRRPLGGRIVDLIAQRPATWGSVRRLAAACLVAVVLASALARDAAAATNLGPGTDPSVSGTTVVWTSPSGGVAQQEDTTDVRTVPPHAAVGGDLIAWRDGDTVHVARLADLAPVLDITVSGVTAVAVSGTWLVTRARSTGGDVLTARRLDAPDAVQTVATTVAPAQLGRPALDGDVLAYHVAARRLSTIVVYDLATATRRVVRRSRSNLLTNPSLLGGELLYDRQTSLGQLVVVGSLDRAGTDRVVYRLGPSATRDAGHQRGYSRHTRTPHPRPAKWRLWTTALSAQRVYVTLLPRFGAPSSARLVSLSR